MMPASGNSTLMMKPMFCQKSFRSVQTLSGEPVTTSQRWLPARSMRILATWGSTSGPVLGRVAWLARSSEYAENVAAPFGLTSGTL